MRYKEKKEYERKEIKEKKAFNNNPRMSLWCLKMREKYNIKTVVETGTAHGLTTNFLVEAFENVYTIEILEEYVVRAREKYKSYKNVNCIHGNSIEVLDAVCEKIDKDEIVLFLLDANGNYLYDLFIRGWRENKGESVEMFRGSFDLTQCPHKKEIEIVSKYFRDRCLLVIDDVCDPGQPLSQYIKYDGVVHGYDYLEPAIKKCYSKFDYHYHREFGLGFHKSRLIVSPGRKESK